MDKSKITMGTAKVRMTVVINAMAALARFRADSVFANATMLRTQMKYAMHSAELTLKRPLLQLMERSKCTILSQKQLHISISK